MLKLFMLDNLKCESLILDLLLFWKVACKSTVKQQKVINEFSNYKIGIDYRRVPLLLVNYFPETKDEVLDQDYLGLIHLQMARFANYANECFETKRFDEINKIFDFIEATVNKVDTEVENALYVSFLEYLDFKGLNEKEIEGYLKADLFNAWIQLRK